jgi:hypothetical protein
MNAKVIALKNGKRWENQLDVSLDTVRLLHELSQAGQIGLRHPDHDLGMLCEMYFSKYIRLARQKQKLRAIWTLYQAKKFADKYVGDMVTYNPLDIKVLSTLYTCFEIYSHLAQFKNRLRIGIRHEVGMIGWIYPVIEQRLKSRGNTIMLALASATLISTPGILEKPASKKAAHLVECMIKELARHLASLGDGATETMCQLLIAKNKLVEARRVYNNQVK